MRVAGVVLESPPSSRLTGRRYRIDSGEFGAASVVERVDEGSGDSRWRVTLGFRG